MKGWAGNLDRGVMSSRSREFEQFGLGYTVSRTGGSDECGTLCSWNGKALMEFGFKVEDVGGKRFVKVSVAKNDPRLMTTLEKIHRDMGVDVGEPRTLVEDLMVSGLGLSITQEGRRDGPEDVCYRWMCQVPDDWTPPAPAPSQEEVERGIF